MNESKCHGWSNWETWLANEWLTADEESQEKLEDLANDSNLEDWEKSDTLKDWIESESPASNGLFADFIDEHLKRIDWEEIIENHTEEN
jgi:hypothetical protein